ncbi:thioesterase II family protein [Streptomyces sp. NPDC127119]|uniref:thioesterase II family protein n=1 Tax=Streptomyces sp. NPDC127119 TaxID=3345370 RepID=UPI003641A680
MSVTSPYSASNWIRDFHPSDRSVPRMVCFPHAGGAANYYFPVSRALSGKVEVLAVQYPGRQDRHTEPPVTDIHALAAHAFRELPREGLDRTWLFGHSMGASIAFEVARLMEGELGVSPAGLIVSGRRAPSRFRGETVHLEDDEALIASVKALNGTDPAVFADPEIRSLVLPTLRADYRAIETYRPVGTARVACPVHAFVGDEDPLTTVEEADCWRAHTEGTFALRVFRGNHFYLAPRADEVIAEISRLILPAEG